MKQLLFFLAVIMLGVTLIIKHSNEEENVYPKLELEESPYGRNEYRNMIRGGQVTKKQYDIATKSVRSDFKKNKKHLQKDGGLAKWDELGPGKFAGRIRAMAFHPDHGTEIWVGGVSGGLWKSTNGGNSWTPKALSMANFSITDILINPDQPDTMYVSTGEGIISPGAAAVTDNNGGQSTPGNGVFRSFDGGDSWERVPAITEFNENLFQFVNVMDFDPTDPSTIYVGTTARDGNGSNTAFGCAVETGEAFRFTSNGDVVEEILSSSCLGGVTSIDIKTSGEGAVLFGQQEGLTKYLPLTASLQQLNGVGGFPSNTGRVTISFYPNSSTSVLALCEGDTSNFGRLYKSSDSGNTWTDLNLNVEPFMTGTGNNQGWYDMALWIDPLDQSRIIIGGVEIYESEDDGNTFQKISDKDAYLAGTSAHADCHVIMETSDYSGSKRTVYFGTDGGVANVSNILNVAPNTAWKIKNGNTLNTTQFYSFDVLGDGTFTNIMGGAQDNGTLLFNEKIGVTEWEHTSGGDGGFCRFGADRHTLYFSRQNGRFFRKNHSDSSEWPMALLDGNTYIGADLAQPLAVCPGGYNPIIIKDSANFITVMEVVPQDRDQLYIGAQRLWRSDDGGCSWSDESPTALRLGTNILAIAASNDGSRIAVGYDNGEVWLGDNNAGVITWEGSASANFFFPITSIAINSQNNAKIMVSIGGYREGNIRYTSNGGSTWEFDRSNGIPALHVNKLLWHYAKSNWIYAATDLGIYASEDNGANWEVTPHFSLNSGPVFNEFTDLKWGPTLTIGGRDLYASSYGRGIWKTRSPVKSDYYFDNDNNTSDEYGTNDDPFNEILDGEAVQAHGQTWHIDGGTYTTSGSVIIDKRIGEVKKTGTGSIVIGDN